MWALNWFGCCCPRAARCVRALSRTSSPAGVIPDAELVVGDLSDRRSLDQAIAGVDCVFLLAGYPETPGLLADLRVAGAGQVVLLSAGAVEQGDPDNNVVRYNLESEAAVRDSGLRWTILRPSGFMSNTLQWIEQLHEGDAVVEPFADVPIAVIHPSDIAAVAARLTPSAGN